ncbi:HTH myb-type domain-containing protein [Pseudoscourfieldia marina]
MKKPPPPPLPPPLPPPPPPPAAVAPPSLALSANVPTQLEAHYDALRTSVAAHAFADAAPHASYIVEAALERAQTTRKDYFGLVESRHRALPLLDHGAELAAETCSALGTSHAAAMELARTARGSLPKFAAFWHNAPQHTHLRASDGIVSAAMAHACAPGASANDVRRTSRRLGTFLSWRSEYTAQDGQTERNDAQYVEGARECADTTCNTSVVRELQRVANDMGGVDALFAHRVLVNMLNFIQWRSGAGHPDAVYGSGAYPSLFPDGVGSGMAARAHEHIVQANFGDAVHSDVSSMFFRASAMHAAGKFDEAGDVLDQACNAGADADATALRAAYWLHVCLKTFYGGDGIDEAEVAVASHLRRDSSNREWIECLAALTTDPIALFTPLIAHVSEQPNECYGWQRLAKMMVDASGVPCQFLSMWKLPNATAWWHLTPVEGLDSLEAPVMKFPWKRLSLTWKRHASVEDNNVQANGDGTPQLVLPLPKNTHWRNVLSRVGTHVQDLMYWCTSRRHCRPPTKGRKELQDILKSASVKMRRRVLLTTYLRMLVTLTLAEWARRDARKRTKDPQDVIDLRNKLRHACKEWYIFANENDKPAMSLRRRVELQPIGLPFLPALLPAPPAKPNQEESNLYTNGKSRSTSAEIDPPNLDASESGGALNTNTAHRETVVPKRKDSQGLYNKISWTAEEHNKFLDGLHKYDKDIHSRYRLIALHVGTKSRRQVASHAQKHFMKEQKEKEEAGTSAGRKRKRQ